MKMVFNNVFLIYLQDLDFYIEKVIFGLKQLLFDLVLEVRIVLFRVFGVMVKGMGGVKFDELFNWLMEILKCEQSFVDRLGVVQGIFFIII